MIRNFVSQIKWYLVKVVLSINWDMATFIDTNTGEIVFAFNYFIYFSYRSKKKRYCLVLGLFCFSVSKTKKKKLILSHKIINEDDYTSDFFTRHEYRKFKNSTCDHYSSKHSTIISLSMPTDIFVIKTKKISQFHCVLWQCVFYFREITFLSRTR